MEYLSQICQITVAISVLFVWIFRYHNVLKEFKQFGLSDITRNMVGSSKTILSSLLVVGIWHKELVLISSVLMALFMVAAQFFHFKVKNPFIKHLPSLILLLLSAYIAYSAL